MLKTGFFMLVSALGLAQAVPLKPKAAEERWLQPAQRITAAIDSDLFRLPRLMQAVAQAQLAAIWWMQDPVSARKWMGAAVDKVTQAPENEADSERTQRIRAARLILPVVTPLDEALRQRILDAMAANVPPGPQSTPAQRENFSNSMVSTAMTDKEHPDRLVRAISDSMQYAVTGATIRGLIELRASSPDQANIIFQRALSLANDYDSARSFSAALRVAADQAPMPAKWRQPSFALLARILSVPADGPTLKKKALRPRGTVDEPEQRSPSRIAASCQRSKNGELPAGSADTRTGGGQ